MGHSVYNRYNMKLNKQLSSYNDLIESITSYLKKCHHIEETSPNPGESYRATISESKGETVISFFNYKSRAPVSLPRELLDLIKVNVNTNPEEFYYYLEQEQYAGWEVTDVYGKAEIVLEQFTTDKKIESNSKELLKSFHNSLYANFNDSFKLTDNQSIINFIKRLSEKAYAIAYRKTKRPRNAYDPCLAYRHRFLIPLFRKEDGTVILAGYNFFKLDFVLFSMRKAEKTYEKGFYISFLNVNLTDFLDTNKDIIVKNLTHPKMVAIHDAMEYYKNYSLYDKSDGYYTHRHDGVVKLFDDNGPFIDVTIV